MTTTADKPVEIHRHHRDVTGGWLRPAVFGVMDGLVSNAALIAGVVGGGAPASATAVAGLAGLVAGACSMATGEYTSVASQSELVHAEIAVERAELAKHPEDEQRELALLFQTRGLDAELAAEVAERLHRDPDVAWRVHVREELGVDPDDLPSPWVAAGSSFLAFALGALIPLLPFLLGRASLGAALTLSVIALFVAGAAVARLTGRSVWFGGGRQLVLGAAAAVVTFGVGSVVGTGLG
ncbi:MAG TPA: VIT1/CCC1 transporter family protein [Streptomyces sp.]